MAYNTAKGKILTCHPTFEKQQSNSRTHLHRHRADAPYSFSLCHSPWLQPLTPFAGLGRLRVMARRHLDIRDGIPLLLVLLLP